MKHLLILSGLLTIPLLLPAQSAREIVKRYLDTVSNGNVENWKKIKSTYTESESYYSQNDFEQKVDFLKKDKPSFSKTYCTWPQQKIENYSDSTFSDLIGSFYFLKDKTIIIIANVPPLIKPPLFRDEFNDEFLPVTIGKLLNNSKSVELIGIRDFPIDGVSCFEIKIKVKDLICYLFINTKTYLLDYYNGREDGDQSFLAKYSNYKKIGDYLIPMSEASIRNGVIFFWNNKRKIELNPEIDPQKFIYKPD